MDKQYQSLRKTLGPLCPSPGTQPRQPPADGRGVLLVGRPELPAQRGLLVAEDEEIHQREPHRPPSEQTARSGEQHLPEHDQADAEIHRVPDEAVRSPNHQCARWIQGTERPSATAGELEDTGGEEHEADSDADQANPVGGLVEVEYHGSEAEVAPGDVAGEQARKENGPEETAEGQPE